MKNNEMVRSILGLLQAKELSRAGAKTLLSMLEETASAYANDRIAIVGLAARMPPGVNADEFWKCLRKGEDLVRPVPQGRAADVDHYYGNTPDEEFGGKRTWDLAYLDRIDLFDAAHFGIGAAEAELMDPAHRMFLEVSAEALQDAGLDGDAIRGTKTAVFSGNPGFHYAEAVAEPSSIAVTGNLPDFMAARVAYLYDLHGPVLSVQAACASSLVAVHEGIRALRERSCDLAIVGGATVFSFPGNIRTNPMTAAGIVSPTERCRPFSEGGDGIGRGEGVVVFVLARIKDAEERRLPVRAVLLGSAVNNDGKSAALTAPNPAAHTALLLEAWSNAGVRPEDIGYIEAHGTG
ncbi:MAG: polyketide synthase, partial [Polyangiaceae bacterium]|nr:polyketide synthase [Polyangiaceae bacterium]